MTRVRAGLPTGGQFAAATHAEASIALTHPAARFSSSVTEHGFTHVDPNAATWPDWMDDVDVASLPIERVALDDITVAAQDHVDPDLVERYRRDGTPPGKSVILRPYGDDDIAVLDGHHEIASRRARGETFLDVRWLDDDPLG